MRESADTVEMASLKVGSYSVTWWQSILCRLVSQASLFFHEGACTDCHRCKAQLGYPRLCLKQELAVKNSFSRRDVLVSLLTGTGKLLCYYVYTAEGTPSNGYYCPELHDRASLTRFASCTFESCWAIIGCDCYS